MASQHPIEIIHARNFITGLSTPGFLVDPEGTLIYFNDAAGSLLGKRFEEAGPLPADEWGTMFEPPGIRSLGLALAPATAEINLLLTHLHLDHIQGLMFFAPFFRASSKVVVWGPEAADAPLVDRIARYISAPLTPLEVRELPCDVSFREAPQTEWRIGSATVQAASVTHRGSTLGYRITEGEEILCYLPDHEPALNGDASRVSSEWISGYALARGATLLLHDGQYTDEEYPNHVGWGHSSVSDALTFARRAEVEGLMLFHHDPGHTDDFLDDLGAEAKEAWAQLAGDPGRLAVAAEQLEVAV